MVRTFYMYGCMYVTVHSSLHAYMCICISWKAWGWGGGRLYMSQEDENQVIICLPPGVARNNMQVCKQFFLHSKPTPHPRGSKLAYMYLLRPMQTNTTLLANNTQHCWAKHAAFVCMEPQHCWYLLRTV